MPEPAYDLHKAAGILIKDRRLLVEKSFNKDFYLAPGGKIHPNETPEQALIRELKEEFAIEVALDALEPFGTFYAPSAGKEDSTLRMDVFIVNAWQGEPAPSSEVENIDWVTSDAPATMSVGSIFAHEVLPRLKKQNLID